jgi:carboxypeptidase C (cathepsin A)
MKRTRLLAFTFALALAAGAFGPAAAHYRPEGKYGQRQHHAVQGKNGEAPNKPPGEGILRLLPADSVTQHTIDTVQGKLAYTATAGTLAFYGESGDQIAAVFYTAYVAKDAGPNRPLTFVSNGGPGAASAFLNLGLVGPRHLDFGPDPHDFAHAKLRDNPYTWLRFTDLVLIDPIGTGWSRTVKPESAKAFWTVGGDAESMAKAIALYVDKNDREASPKYLMGSSYGAFRAVKTARALQREQGISVNGIVMLSPFLEGWLTFANDQSPLRAALELPSLAAANLERKNALIPQALVAAEKFALGDYLTTLAGPTPQGKAAEAFYARVAQVSGLPLDMIKRQSGFVTGSFVKNLRPGEIVSEYDPNFAVDDPFPVRQSAQREPDPILDAVVRAYGGAFANYARNKLGFKTEMTYKLLANDVTSHWNWGKGGREEVGVGGDLRVLLCYDHSFRVLIAHGYSDLVTPFSDTRYLIDHLPPLRPPGRVSFKLYHGGHMIYLVLQSRIAFSNDAAAFYRTNIQPVRPRAPYLSPLVLGRHDKTHGAPMGAMCS